MKQILTISLAAVLLTGCGASSEQNLTTTVSETAEEVITTEETTITETAAVTETETITETAAITSVSETSEVTAEETTTEEMITESYYEFPEITVEKRDDLAVFVPASASDFVERLFVINCDNDELRDTLDKAKNLYYENFKKFNWNKDSKYGENGIDGFYPTGVSYESYYSFLSDIFTYDFICEMEETGIRYAPRLDGNGGYGEADIDFKPFINIDGELYACAEPARGMNPMNDHVEMNAEKVSDSVYTIEIKEMSWSSDDEYGELYASSYFTAAAFKSADGKWHLDKFYYPA